jgi:hypothetical protein
MHRVFIDRNEISMVVVVLLFGKLEARIQIRTIFGGVLRFPKFLENNTVIL